MTKQLTDGERESMEQARLEYVPYYTGYEIEEKQGFRGGFVAGLSHNQAKLDKLIAFIRGEITQSEIEDLL